MSVVRLGYLEERRLPAIKAMGSRAFAATQRKAHEPQHEEDDRRNPQQMDGEAQSEEQQHQKQCQQEHHGFILSTY